MFPAVAPTQPPGQLLPPTRLTPAASPGSDAPERGLLDAQEAAKRAAVGVAFGMAVAQGEAQIALDTLDSLVAHFPGASRWILDDCTTDGTYEALARWVGVHGGHLLRNPTPRGYRGIAGSFYSLLATIAREEPNLEIAIKIDPDTCLLGGDLLERIRARFAECGPGVVGAYRVGAGGRPRVFGHIRRNMLVDLLLPIGPHKTWRAVRVGPPYWARFLFRAKRHGYVFGEHVLGALAAIHVDTVRALLGSGFLDVPPRFRALTVQMDVVLGLGVRAVGHALIDLDSAPPSRPVVWLQFLPPVPLSADEVLARGMLAVHPVKASPEGQAMREVFRRRRSSKQASPAGAGSAAG
jgi:hypothetical protein